MLMDTHGPRRSPKRPVWRPKSVTSGPLGWRSCSASRCPQWPSREQLEAALDYARAGDVLVVTKLDRLARSIRDLCSIVDRLTAKGVSLRILGMGLDTATANGRLMLNVLGSVAQFEREVMLERQREGIAKAKVEGKFKGRAPTARSKAEEVKALVAAAG